MATLQGVKAGAAIILLKADDKVTDALEKIEWRLHKIAGVAIRVGKQMAQVAHSSIVKPLFEITRQAAVLGDQMNKMSIRTNIAVSELSKMRLVAQENDISFKSFGDRIVRLQRRLGQGIAFGKGPAKEATDLLGLDAKTLSDKAPLEAFADIADAIAGIQDHSTASALAFKLFGKQYEQLLPLLLQGGDNIREAAKRAEELGLVVTDAEAALSAKFMDTLTRVGEQFNIIKLQIGLAIMEGIQPFIQGITRYMRMGIDWFRANKKLVLSIFVIGSTVLGAGIALFSFGVAVLALAFVIKGLAIAFSLLTTALIFLMGVLTGPIIGPLLLFAAGFSLALAAAWQFSEGVRNMFKDLFSGMFKALDNWFGHWGKVLHGIFQALKSADFGTAWHLILLGLTTTWNTFVVGLKESWFQFTMAFKEMFHGASMSVSAWALSAFAELLKLYNMLPDAMKPDDPQGLIPEDVDEWLRLAREDLKRTDTDFFGNTGAGLAKERNVKAKEFELERRSIKDNFNKMFQALIDGIKTGVGFDAAPVKKKILVRPEDLEGKKTVPAITALIRGTTQAAQKDIELQNQADKLDVKRNMHLKGIQNAVDGIQRKLNIA